jgi:PKD repeat protein
MLNGNNEIGLGYSISSSVLPPGIRYCGQTQAEYNAGSGILDFPEQTIVEGTLSQTESERWGDYAQMSVDPSDDRTFWFTSEYAGNSVRKTKIGSFKIGPIAPTANFTANDTFPCINTTTVNFTSHIKGQVTQYLWTFTPATITFTGGTANTSADPQVIFNAYGNYSVALTVTGEGGTSTTTKTNYIHVNEASANFSANVTNIVIGNNITFNASSLCDISTWLWDFGAGASPATSISGSPQTVSYSSTGLKTVSLTINSSTTNTRTDYINVIEPDINMSSSTVAACNGTFYDHGGPSADYGSNEDYSMLFYPGDTNKVLEFVFTSFDIESQTTCDNDYLKVYDGESLSAPLIGTFCGTNSPGTIKASNDAGALLFVFHSNNTLNFPGWSAAISCKAIPPDNPTALTAYLASTTQVDLAWTKNENNNDILLAWSPDGTFGTPADGTPYSPGQVIPGGGTVLTTGSESNFNHTGLNPSTTYYYKAFSYDALTNYSSGITANVITSLQLSVTPLGINASSQAGSTPVSIYSNTSWTATSDQVWCTVLPEGTGNLVINANYTENPSVNSRIAHITITVTGLPPVVVTLLQAGKPLLIVTPSNQDVSDLSGNTTFSVISNGNWTVSSNQSWCAVNLTGSGNGTITAVYSQNPFLNSRTATISVYTEGLPSVYVTITQSASTPILTVTPAVKYVNSYAAFADFTVTSNVAWTASADSAWCIVTKSGSGNGTITALYSANPYNKERSTNISVQASGVSTQVVTLVQGFGTASVPDKKINGIEIYPNPTNGLFSIEVDKSKFPAFKVLILDITGVTITSRECKGESEYVFDLSKSPQGTYFVKIKTDKELLVTKVVVIK